jgi:hypothetical protein
MVRHLTAAVAAMACAVGVATVDSAHAAGDHIDAELGPGADQPTLLWEERLNLWLQLVGSELFPIVVDGVFDAETEAATRQFQDTYPGVETQPSG